MSFRTFDLALELQQEVNAFIKSKRIRGIVRDQLERAVLSIPLNLTEGSSRPSEKERKRFYTVALGSLREVHCLLKIIGCLEFEQKVDKLGAHLYRLIHSRSH